MVKRTVAGWFCADTGVSECGYAGFGRRRLDVSSRGTKTAVIARAYEPRRSQTNLILSSASSRVSKDGRGHYSPSFRGAPLGASPESILPIVVMDSGPAPRGASRNDERGVDQFDTTAKSRLLIFGRCQAPKSKIFRFTVLEIRIINLAIPAHTRGVSRSSRCVGPGMRWTLWRQAFFNAGRKRQGVRRSRVVLAPRCWR